MQFQTRDAGKVQNRCRRCTSNLKQGGRCISTNTGKCVGGWSPVLQIEAAPPVHTEVILVIERQSQYPIGVNPLFKKGSGSPLFSHHRCYSNVTNHTAVAEPCNWITVSRYRAICPFFLSGHLNSPLLGHRSASTVCSHRCRIKQLLQSLKKANLRQNTAVPSLKESENEWTK